MYNLFKLFFIACFIPFVLLCPQNVKKNVKKELPKTNNKNRTYSNKELDNALKGCNAPKEITQNLILVKVEFYSFDNKLHSGHLVINKKIEKDVVNIFKKIKEQKFPIEKVTPIAEYKWNDALSMEANNTSAFNYRRINGTKLLSKHSYGLAIDINPRINPRIKGKIREPKNAIYNSKGKGVFSKDSPIVKEFIKLGWKWGGNWKFSKDYQHFEK